MNTKSFYVTVSGIVQGVGFRPYVYKLAQELALCGWVLNSPAGVELVIEGDGAACAAFLARLKTEAPRASHIDRLTVNEQPARGEGAFNIRSSISGPRRTLISPDLAICDDCLSELRDPTNRRYRYPFINCTNCGPRFTIIENLPYDRLFTTMKDFVMCPDCQAEYRDPRDRRFHAQPNACATCGPTLRFLDGEGREQPGDPLQLAETALKAGQILAVKGLGGFHLACDALNQAAVMTLRGRKLRWHKPFALMLPDLARVRLYCQTSVEEEELLKSAARPIVLLKRGNTAPPLCAAIAPDSARLGVMLPYTPLHHLLLEGWQALVMTSANYSDEPIAYTDGDALSRLSGLADAFLLHDRPIFRRADDSVAVWAAGAPRLNRRSRGYAPQPLNLPGCEQYILALGGQEKNTFCLTRGSEAFLSQHIGELSDAATYQQYCREIEHFCAMFQIKPELAACDLHPDYLTSRYAAQSGLPVLAVQHHHAHLASVLAEHQLDGPALGFIFDGTGYGLDGHLWGGEVLYGDCHGFERLAHLDYLPLPGGEAAIREPWRQALAALYLAGGADLALDRRWRWPDSAPILLQSLQKGVNAPLACGLGRLFDTVAAIAGLYPTVSYEGQAALALEQLIDESAQGAYRFELRGQAGGPVLIDWRPLIRAAAADIGAGATSGLVAARFHRALACLCSTVAQKFRKERGAEIIALSGGCWQNIWLLEQVTADLQQQGFRVYSNSAVPVNDGGLSLGQAAVASISRPSPAYK